MKPLHPFPCPLPEIKDAWYRTYDFLISKGLLLYKGSVDNTDVYVSWHSLGGGYQRALVVSPQRDVLSINLSQRKPSDGPLGQTSRDNFPALSTLIDFALTPHTP